MILFYTIDIPELGNWQHCKWLPKQNWNIKTLYNKNIENLIIKKYIEHFQNSADIKNSTEIVNYLRRNGSLCFPKHTHSFN